MERTPLTSCPCEQGYKCPLIFLAPLTIWQDLLKVRVKGLCSLKDLLVSRARELFVLGVQDTFTKPFAWESLKLMGFDYRALGSTPDGQRRQDRSWSLCQVFFLSLSIYINNLHPPGLEDPARVLSGILAGKGNLMLAAGCLRDFSGEVGGVLGIKGICWGGEIRFGEGDLGQGPRDPKIFWRVSDRELVIKGHIGRWKRGIYGGCGFSFLF